MESVTTGKVVIEVRNIGKSFAGVSVLRDVSLTVLAGEVHTIMGENGAGKSTLLKIMGGVHQPDAGEIFVDGHPVHIGSPTSAQRHGIALIHQEPLCFPDLDIAENIYLGHVTGSGTSHLGILNRRKMYDDARRTLESLGVNLNPRSPMRGLSIADQQMVELAAALSQKSQVLLMDEPTAALTPAEVEDLFAIVRRLRQQGVAIVFISHRLEEVLDISDRITVLRDGQFVGTKRADQTDAREIISMMVGRPLGEVYQKEPAKIGPAYLKVDRLGSPGRFRDISLEVHAGEIVGVAGLVGAGRTELAETIFGLHPVDAGQIYIDDHPVTIGSPRDAIRRGIAYVPEDRQRHGLLTPMSIAANTTLSSLSKISFFGWLLPRRQRRAAEKYRQLLQTRCQSVDQPVRQLSGGNQQKVVLGKWLMTEPNILILDEPTRGIDIGAKAEVHHVMSDLARSGKAILMISSDLPEVLAISDRIVVMREGRIAGEFSRGQATQEKVMAAATASGGGTDEPAIGRAGESAKKTSRPVAPSPGRGFAFSPLRFRELGIALVVLLTFFIAAGFDHRFVSRGDLLSILLYIPLILVASLGQMMVIVSRNIDLSVGSILGFTAIVVGGVFVHHPAFPIWAAALLSLGVGGILGLFNGVLVAFLNIPSIIATLGTLSAYRGLVFIYSGGKQVDPNNIPPALIRLSEYPVSLPWIVIFALVLTVLAHLFLKYTRLGREIFAIGSNPAAAALRGIAVRRNLIFIFTLAGCLGGIAGLMYASRFGYVNPVQTGKDFELVVISAVVIGGVSIFGGSGSVLGVALGCLLLGIIAVALPALGVSDFYQLAIYGLAIVLAAAIDRLMHHLSGASA